MRTLPDPTRMALALADLPQAARRKKRKLPVWIGQNLLGETIDNAFHDAITSVPDSLEWDQVTDYVEQRIEAAVEALLAPCPEDWRQTPRGHALKDGYFRKGARYEAIDDMTNDDIDDDLGDNLRTRIEQNEPEFLQVIAATRRRKFKTAFGMIWLGASLGEIRNETKLTGPEIIREYLRILSELRKSA